MLLTENLIAARFKASKRNFHWSETEIKTIIFSEELNFNVFYSGVWVSVCRETHTCLKLVHGTKIWPIWWIGHILTLFIVQRSCYIGFYQRHNWWCNICKHYFWKFTCVWCANDSYRFNFQAGQQSKTYFWARTGVFIQKIRGISCNLEFTVYRSWYIWEFLGLFNVKLGEKLPKTLKL